MAIAFKEKYNIDISLNELPENLSRSAEMTSADMLSLFNTLKDLDKALKLYPIDTLRNSHFNVSVVGSLSRKGFFLGSIISEINGIESQGNVALRSRGIIDHTFPLNLIEGVAGMTPERTIHHELLHAIDYETLTPQDRILWDGLNKGQYEGESFGTGGGLVRPAGFSRPYGKTNGMEDRATVGELLMTDLKQAYEIAKEDEIFAKKNL